MIRMQYKQFADRNFIQAVQALAQAKLRFPGALSLKNMVGALTKAQKQIGAEHAEMLAKLTNPGEGADEAAAKVYVEAREKHEEDFGHNEFIIERLPLKYAILGDNYQISAQDLTFLAPLFEDLEVIPAEGASVHPISGAV